MGAFANLRFFRLSDNGVQCDAKGCFVGAVALLRGSPGGERWSVRPLQDLDEELSALYGWPIDVAAKRGRLEAVAGALQRGEMALAKNCGTLELAERLFESGLLKGGWDSTKHPRTGEAPNRGWFARKPEELSPRAAPTGEWRGLGEVVRRTLIEARALLKEAGKKAVETGEAALWLDPELRAAITALIEVLEALEPTDLNANEQQAIDQVRAATDPPKTLEELQQPPMENALGYEQHHIVEQNPDNLAKSPDVVLVVKFGEEVIDDPSNLVWVPRLKHERVTALYNSKVPGDPQGRLYRQVVNAMDYQSQRAAGLAALRLFGVLQ